eukprot:IDg21596t1
MNICASRSDAFPLTSKSTVGAGPRGARGRSRRHRREIVIESQTHVHEQLNKLFQGYVSPIDVVKKRVSSFACRRSTSCDRRRFPSLQSGGSSSNAVDEGLKLSIRKRRVAGSVPMLRALPTTVAQTYHDLTKVLCNPKPSKALVKATRLYKGICDDLSWTPTRELVFIDLTLSFNPNLPVFDFTLPGYRIVMRSIIASLQLPPSFTPRYLRAGGASTDVFEGVPQDEIKARGK